MTDKIIYASNSPFALWEKDRGMRELSVRYFIKLSEQHVFDWGSHE
jgi:hypothetical protein